MEKWGGERRKEVRRKGGEEERRGERRGEYRLKEERKDRKDEGWSWKENIKWKIMLKRQKS